MHRAVLLDTSFFLRFLNEKDPLFKNADGYFRHFLQKEITMMVSTISIGEYCVGGDVHEFNGTSYQMIQSYLHRLISKNLLNFIFHLIRKV